METSVEINAKSDNGRKAGTRDAQRLATRGAALDAAITLFATRGFDGTALPAITAICGVPVPLIIYHFKSKELLWKAAVDEVYRRLDAHIVGYADEIANAEGIDFYRTHIRALVTAVATHPEYMRILFQEGTQTSDRLTWLVERHQNRMTKRQTDLIRQAQADGIVGKIDPIHAKFIFSGAFILPIVLAAEYRMISDDDPLDPVFVDRHIEVCLRLLLPKLLDAEA
jgi:TetR/AcrR family transcriptional regulator